LKLLQNSAERKACCTLWGDRAALNSEAEKAEEAVCRLRPNDRLDQSEKENLSTPGELRGLLAKLALSSPLGQETAK